MSLTIKMASGDDDIATLASLRRAWNEEHAGGAIDDDAFEATFAAWVRAEGETRTHFIAERDGRPIGMANVKHYQRMPVAGRGTGGWWGYVGNVFVLPEDRNGRVGDELMRAVAAWAWQHGAAHLRLAPSPRSWPFYGRLGFEPGSVVELDPPARPGAAVAG